MPSFNRCLVFQETLSTFNKKGEILSFLKKRKHLDTCAVSVLYRYELPWSFFKSWIISAEDAYLNKISDVLRQQLFLKTSFVET